MKSRSILEKFNVKLRKNAKSEFVTEIFSRGVSLRASISIGSSYLYSKYYHAKRFFGSLIFAIIARMLCGNHLKKLKIVQFDNK